MSADKIKQITKREFRIILLVAITMGMGLFVDHSFNSGIVKIIILMLGFTTILALASHAWRRLLAPYIDLKQYAFAALQDKNIAAAIVFASVCWLISVMMYIAYLMFTHPMGTS